MNLIGISTLALLVGMGAPAGAQEARMGVAVNLAAPTGAFRSTDYPPYGTVVSTSNESYDLGVGVQLTFAFPLDRRTAFRLNLGGQGFSGRATAPGYDRMNLQQQMFSIGAELQIFPGDGNAFRQSGTYFLIGPAVDFERFDSSYGDPNYYPDYTVNKTRLGGVVGIGHTFRPHGGMRYSLEAAFHKTLNATDTAAGNPPASDYLKLGFGLVF